MIEEIQRAVVGRLDDLHDLTQRLVRERSLLGNEEGAQRIVEERLRRIGFVVERVPIDGDDALADPRAGIPLLPYAGRTNVAGRIVGSDGRPTLHLSGHVDVVPVESPERWTRDPWGGEIADGRIWGRGAGDMKAGVAAYLIATEAFLEVCGPPTGDLLFTSVIEEECGGNGMRAVVRAGYDAGATLIGEPFWPHFGNGGVGVIWARLTARGSGAHAAIADAVPPPLEALVNAIAALRELESELNATSTDAAFTSAFAHPFNLNLGEIRGGVWPSSVPAEIVLRIRLGFGRDLEPVEAQRLVLERVTAASPAVEVAFEGFRAHAYVHDPATPLADLVRGAHEAVTGSAPLAAVSSGTTDARFVAGPCYCYGPLAGNGHGSDEWVDLDSLHQVTTSIALVLTRWFGTGSSGAGPGS